MAVSENDLLVGPVTPASGVDTISLDFDGTGWQASWLEVYKGGSEAPLVLNTDYTVTDAGLLSATVTLAVPASGTDAYSVYLVTPAERSSDFQLRGEFKSGPLNVELDRIWQRIQYDSTQARRALRVSRTDEAPDTISAEDGQYIIKSGNNYVGSAPPTYSDLGNAIFHSRDATSAMAVAALTDGSITLVDGQFYEVDSGATGVESAFNDLGVDGVRPYPTNEPSPQHFGYVSGSAVPAINRMVAYVNAIGDAARSAYAMVKCVFPTGTYDIRAGGIAALLVSNVLFSGGPSAALQMRDGPFVEAGSAATFIENIHLRGFQPFTSTSELPPVKPADITGATQANPVVITAAQHGYTTGQKIRIQSMTAGMTQINEREFTITVLDIDSFSLDGEDGAGHGAYTSGGVAWPATDCALVKGVNCARVFIGDVQCYRMPHLFKAVVPAGAGISRVHVGSSNSYGTGHPSYNWIDIDTINANFAAGLFVSIGGYPYAPPVNPAIVPVAITGATQANPVVITSPGHGLTADNKVRFRDVGGMTELNGNDYDIFVLDANSFSLVGVDGSGFSAYTSGGAVAGVHWAEDYRTAVISINGMWDTAVVADCTLQHWNWLWKLRSVGTISFVRANDVLFDYVGHGLIHAIYAGGSIGEVDVQGGWSFAMNGDWYSYVAEAGGSLVNLTANGHVVGLSGGDIITDIGRILHTDFSDGRVIGIGRLKSGTSHAWQYLDPNTKSLRLSGNQFEDPDIRYGAGASNYLLPTHGITVAAAVEVAHIEGNHVNARTKFYDIAKPTTGNGAGRRLLNNTRHDEKMPEYVGLELPVVTTGTFVWQNTLGCPVNVSIFGGTVTGINLSYLNASDVEITTTATGQTEGVFTVGPGQKISIVNSAVPTMRVIPCA